MRTALLALVLVAAPVVAQDAPTADEERLRHVQERRTALEQELKRLRGEERSLLGEVEQLEVELRLRTEELREIRLNLRRTQSQLDATVERVREIAQRELELADSTQETLALTSGDSQRMALGPLGLRQQDLAERTEAVAVALEEQSWQSDPDADPAPSEKHGPCPARVR